jgi:hypothetical protein
VQYVLMRKWGDGLSVGHLPNALASLLKATTHPSMSAHGDHFAKVPSMVCASDVVPEGIELRSPCYSTYVSHCTIGYPRCWSARCCSSCLDSFLSRTSSS